MVAPNQVSPTESSAASSRPLCVDLDGTLVKSDTLVDSLLVLVRTRPALIFKLPGRLLRGKAAFKAFVTESVSLDVAHLPYNLKLLQFLREQHSQGRDHLSGHRRGSRACPPRRRPPGIFRDVLGSDGATNLTGRQKARRPAQPPWPGRIRLHRKRHAGSATAGRTPKSPCWPIPASRCASGSAPAAYSPCASFDDRSNFAKSLVRAMRPHQWAKNLLDLSTPSAVALRCH